MPVLRRRIRSWIAIKDLLKGWHNTDNWRSSLALEKVRYLRLLNDMEVMESVLQAEKEGYDAVVIGCFWNPCLREARDILDIPVAGATEFSASLQGTRFAEITTCEDWVSLMTKNMSNLTDKLIPCRPVRSLTVSEETFLDGCVEPRSIP
ncbi:MAG: aspartate/glutamate racemase family protein [Candidatus Bathyarchaeia archaeon]